MLEILNRSLMRYCCISGGKGSKILTLSSLCVFLARVQTKLAGLEFPNHRKVLVVGGPSTPETQVSALAYGGCIEEFL